MRINEVMRNIALWQKTSGFLPLTCENDPLHSLLVPKIVNGSVCLNCPDCEYIQTSIPSIFWEDAFEYKFNVQNEYFKSHKNKIGANSTYR